MSKRTVTTTTTTTVGLTGLAVAALLGGLRQAVASIDALDWDASDDPDPDRTTSPARRQLAAT